jgi:dihydroxyacetone kinase-like predicted kinase
MSAMIAYNPDGEVEDVVAGMKEAMGMVTSMSVTFAVRDTQIDRFSIKKDQFLGLVEGKIACVANDSYTCAKQLVRGMTGAMYITVFYGEGVSEEDAAVLQAKAEERFTSVDISVVFGGQPVYYYIISIE